MKYQENDMPIYWQRKRIEYLTKLTIKQPIKTTMKTAKKVINVTSFIIGSAFILTIIAMVIDITIKQGLSW